MFKKLFTKEVKIGVAFIAALACIFFGINYLKGINIFTPSNHYYAEFDQLGGLVTSNGVFVKGYKVGQVREISYDFNREHPFVVDLLVNDDIKLPKGSKVVLKDDGLMGGKIIELVYTEVDELYASGDTIPSELEGGLMAQMGELVPKLEQTFSQVDSLLSSLNAITSSSEVKKSLSSIEKTTADLQSTSAQLKKVMNNQVPSILSDVNVITGDLKKVSGDLKQVEFAQLFARIDKTVNNLQIFSDNLNSQNGTLGLLMTDKSLYNNLNSTAKSADNLLIDLKANPKRYVHFSLWGSKEKK